MELERDGNPATITNDAMERRSFLQALGALAAVPLVGCAAGSTRANAGGRSDAPGQTGSLDCR